MGLRFDIPWRRVAPGLAAYLTLCILPAQATALVPAPAASTQIAAQSVRLAQARTNAADMIYPIQRHQRPRFRVGDTAPHDARDQEFFPGMDLPRLGDAERYIRTDEFVYRIDAGTRRILEVIPIATVILR